MDREKLISLVTGAQAGDSCAINDLFNAFYNDVYFFALKTCGSEDNACEITQETFIEIINTIGSLQEPAAFVTWMKQITYHQCTRFFRKQKSRDKYETLTEENEDGVSVLDFAVEDRQEFIPDEAVDQKEFCRVILDMLDRLSPEQRSAMILYYYDELSVKQIAEIQNVSEGAVKSRLFHGRRSIKRSVEDYEKKNNVKLHSFGMFPLFLLLFQNRDKLAGGALVSVVKGVSAATSTAVTVSVVGAGAVGSGAAAATGLLASIPAAVKAVAAVAAIVLTLGGGAAILSAQDDPAVPHTTLAVMATMSTTAPSTQAGVPENIPPETVIPDSVPPETVPTITEPETVPPETVPTVTEPAETIPPETTTPVTPLPDPEPEPDPDPEPEPDAEITGYVIPEGCTYTTADGTILGPGDVAPACTPGDTMVSQDYTYTYSADGWGVIVNDQGQTSYSPLLGEINGARLTNMESTFRNCTAMTQAPEIPDGVTNLSYTFYGCSSLTQAPVIPEGVTDLSHSFAVCNSMKIPPAIPDSVTNMEGTFLGCTALTQAPLIPNGVTNLVGTFGNCSSLTQAPAIPEGITDLTSTFANCTALRHPPAIPTSVINMSGTFRGCTSMISAPDIPSSVRFMDNTFYWCTSLGATIVIDANPEIYAGCFEGTVELIILTGSSTLLEELAATGIGGYVVVQ